jgi:hypothetical protein
LRFIFIWDEIWYEHGGDWIGGIHGSASSSYRLAD